ncbi:hypothetical protein INR49_004367, partial [Caranx melampygus]
MILVCWVISALIGICIIVAGFSQGTCEEMCSVDVVMANTMGPVFSFYLPAIIMLCIYFKIFLVAQKQMNSIQSTKYYAVCQPLSYKSKINGRVIVVMILVSWGLAALIGIGIIIAGFNQGKCEESCLIDALISTTLACVFSFYIPVIIMLSIYLKIFLVAQKQAHSIQSTNCQSTKSGAAVSKMERKATKTLATVLGVFLLCWTPYFLCIVFQPLTYSVTPIAVIETLNWLTLSNSMLNPFIYAFFYSWFRSAFRMIISGKIFK